MKRGDIFLVALQGDYGKPRPAVVIQSDVFISKHSSIVLCPITSKLEDAPLLRITLEPSKSNGLRKVSQIMTDKLQTARRERLKEWIGQLDNETMVRLNRTLIVFLGLM